MQQGDQEEDEDGDNQDGQSADGQGNGNGNGNGNGGNNNGATAKQLQQQQQQQLDRASATNLIINYLPQDMTDRELYNLFSGCGPINTCKIMRDFKVSTKIAFCQALSGCVCVYQNMQEPSTQGQLCGQLVPGSQCLYGDQGTRNPGALHVTGAVLFTRRAAYTLASSHAPLLHCRSHSLTHSRSFTFIPPSILDAHRSDRIQLRLRVRGLQIRVGLGGRHSEAQRVLCAQQAFEGASTVPLPPGCPPHTHTHSNETPTTLQVSYARPGGQSIKDTNLYVINLPRNINDEMLDRIFSAFGQIVQRNILRDKLTGRPRGVAFVR